MAATTKFGSRSWEAGPGLRAVRPPVRARAGRLVGPVLAFVVATGLLTSCGDGGDGDDDDDIGAGTATASTWPSTLPTTAAGGSGPAGPEAPPPSGSSSDAEDAVVRQFVTWTREALAGAGAVDHPLDCPPEPPTPVVEVTPVAAVGRGRPALAICDAPVMLASATTPGATAFAIRARNDAPVPVRITSPSTGLARVHYPGEVFDLPIETVVQRGDEVHFEYRIDAEGIAFVLADRLLGSLPQPKGIGALGCVLQPEAQCVIDNLADVLPQQVQVGRFRVPARQIGQLVGTAVATKPLYDEWRRLEDGYSAGTLTARYLGFG